MEMNFLWTTFLEFLTLFILLSCSWRTCQKASSIMFQCRFWWSFPPSRCNYELSWNLTNGMCDLLIYSPTHPYWMNFIRLELELFLLQVHSDLKVDWEKRIQLFNKIFSFSFSVDETSDLSINISDVSEYLSNWTSTAKALSNISSCL